MIRTIFPGFRAIWGPNDEQFAGLSYDKEVPVINIWNTETGEILSSLEINPYGFHISWNFEANVIAGAPYQENLFIWDIDTGMRYDFEDIKTQLLLSIEWRPNSNQLAITDYDGSVVILSFEFGV
jgi:WD40 repeat protein